MERALFIQISDKVYHQQKYVKDYFKLFYDKYSKFGYYRHKHYIEYPQWIPMIKGSLNLCNIKGELYILKKHSFDDIAKLALYINSNNIKYVFISLMSCNKYIIHDIINNIYNFSDNGNVKIIVGGYERLDKSVLLRSENIIEVDTLYDIEEFIPNIQIFNKWDYSLFKNEPTVPRLNLSHNCDNNCLFCCVKKGVEKIDFEDILKRTNEIMSQLTNFKLIYIGDKTFGQANNYGILKQIYKIVKANNPQFEGFIVQTTPNMITPEFADILTENHVVIVELGIESVCDSTLKYLRKPRLSGTITMESVLYILKTSNIKAILNIIVGLPNETPYHHSKNISFIKDHINNIFALNIFNLAIYEGNGLNIQKENCNKKDFSENSIDKSFYTDEQNRYNTLYHKALYKLATQIVNINS